MAKVDGILNEDPGEWTGNMQYATGCSHVNSFANCNTEVCGMCEPFFMNGNLHSFLTCLASQCSARLICPRHAVEGILLFLLRGLESSDCG